jgi:peptide/nickel transport system substrate-binding protein
MRTFLKTFGTTLFLGIFFIVAGQLFFKVQFDTFVLKLFEQERDVVEENVLIIGLSSELTSLSPLNNEVANRERLLMIYEALVRTDANLQVQPALALSFGAIDDTTWEFRLRPDVNFHDGNPLSMDDVLTSIKRANVPTVADVKKIDDEHFSIITTEVDPLLLQRLASVLIFPQNASSLEASPVGTGPYNFKSLEKGVMTLERFFGYWGKESDADLLEIRSIPSRDARREVLVDGDVDILSGVPPEIISDFSFDEYEIVSSPTLESSMLLFGFDGPFKRKELREAALLSLDRAEVTRLTFGFAEQATQFVGKGIYGHDPAIVLPGKDSEKARSIVSDFSSYPVEISVDLPQGFEALGEFLAESLRDVGFFPKLSFLQSNELQARILSGDADIFFFGWRFELGDARGFLNEVAHSPRGGFGSFNTGYRNMEVDRLIEESNSILSPLQRLEALREVMRIITLEDTIGIPLFSPEALYAVKHGVSFKARPDGYVLAGDVTQ